ncbi:MAG: ABC transporter ATP-binding protein [Pseudomonadota bacterium]
MAATKNTKRSGASAPFGLELRGVSKSFGPIQANQNIDLAVERGTIHGIVGENGAGKSTLMNILYGMHRADEGEMLIDGAVTQIKSSADAIALGIGMVHQHFMLVPRFTVVENVMLGSEGGVLLKEGRAHTLDTLQSLSDTYGMHVDPNALVGDLNVGNRQRVEILKALKHGADILILDEPTGVLTPQETEQLFEILRSLRADGKTVLMITHKLEEIMSVTDNVSIMRRGEMVGHRKTSATSTQELAELMVGRSVLLEVDRGTSSPGDTALSVENLTAVSSTGVTEIDGISFDVRAGEILGIAGVSGNGQTPLMEILGGMRAPTSGRVRMLGHQIDKDHLVGPEDLRDSGLGHIPEDRHHHGLILDFLAQENMIFGYHHDRQTGSGILINPKTIADHTQGLMDHFDIRPPNPELPARNFSGGNQQKIVIAREMHPNPKVLIVGQPTRGVDVGAIEFIHKQLIALRDQGCAIVLVSVELDEVMSLSDRIIVMNDGHIVGELANAEFDENRIGLMMAGIAEDAA